LSLEHCEGQINLEVSREEKGERIKVEDTTPIFDTYICAAEKICPINEANSKKETQATILA
jgi:hypothetical protein